jgi:hypothetical protein
MAIKANNINVGKKVEPEKAPPNNNTIGGIKAANIIVLKKEEPTLNVVKSEPVIPEKYIVRKDGDLIMNLNTKSDYLRDVLDLD